MGNQTEYGEWLSAQKVACDAQVELITGMATSATLEAESEYSAASTAAVQLKLAGVEERMKVMALASDIEWADNSS